ncbi:MAG: sigma-70 family RNA polymerase sigma factor [Deltaproteobacteria bacterium]|nr:sigma-70 family RNA polymerase sigma factor [Deltaproteobacteria bacterium]
MTAEEEKDIARDIREAERRARRALVGVAVAERELRQKPKRAERTRAGAVDRIEQAVFAAWDAARSDLSVREQARHARQAWADAERLRWQLAMSGRRIAHGEARKLAGPYMDEVDLVQEGYIGLLRAAKRFDPDRDIRFSTYARWWVRAQMTRAIDHTGRTVRLPGCAVEQTRNLRKAIRNFETAGAAYTVADLAIEVGIDERRARFLLSQGQTVSLEEPVEEGPRPRSVEQFLSDETVPDPDMEAIRVQEIRRMLDGLGEVLSDRHRYVLMRRYGLEDDRFRTLSEVGKGMDLSRERVRQIEREALNRLRDHARIRDVA